MLEKNLTQEARDKMQKGRSALIFASACCFIFICFYKDPANDLKSFLEVIWKLMMSVFMLALSFDYLENKNFYLKTKLSKFSFQIGIGQIEITNFLFCIIFGNHIINSLMKDQDQEMIKVILKELILMARISNILIPIFLFGGTFFIILAGTLANTKPKPLKP